MFARCLLLWLLLCLPLAGVAQSSQPTQDSSEERLTLPKKSPTLLLSAEMPTLQLSSPGLLLSASLTPPHAQAGQKWRRFRIVTAALRLFSFNTERALSLTQTSLSLKKIFGEKGWLKMGLGAAYAYGFFGTSTEAITVLKPALRLSFGAHTSRKSLSLSYELGLDLQAGIGNIAFLKMTFGRR